MLSQRLESAVRSTVSYLHVSPIPFDKDLKNAPQAVISVIQLPGLDLVCVRVSRGRDGVSSSPALNLLAHYIVHKYCLLHAHMRDYTVECHFARLIL